MKTKNLLKNFCLSIQRLLLPLGLVLLILFTGCNSKSGLQNAADNSQNRGGTPSVKTNRLNIAKIALNHDQDRDGINDLEDILAGARDDAANKPSYRSAYYSGGYPPDNEGVCTDTIWRAFKSAGYNLKGMVDRDIRENTSLYKRVSGSPDPNIDFRRVPNLISFFKRHADVLTTDIKPGDIDNLEKWQGGDVVVFGKPLDHIAIVSDIRREDGVPFIVHNGGPYTQEEDMLLYWHENISPIVYHFRFPKSN